MEEMKSSPDSIMSLAHFAITSSSSRDDMMSLGHTGLLSWASYRGDLEAVKEMVSSEEDMEVAFRGAVHTGQLPIIEWLVGEGCEIPEDAISDVVFYRRLNVLKWFVSGGHATRDDLEYALESAIWSDNREIIEYLLGEGIQLTEGMLDNTEDDELKTYLKSKL